MAVSVSHNPVICTRDLKFRGSATCRSRARAEFARSRVPMRQKLTRLGAASVHEMNIVTLGNSDLKVSEVCMGTMTFGEQNGEREAHEMLDICAEAGVNFLDTAEMYPVAPRRETQGRTSEIVGTWMKGRSRSSLVVASKVAGCSVRQPWIPASRTVPRGEERVPRVDSASIREACEAELRRLQTDYIDLMYIHWPDRYVPGFGTHRHRLDREREAIPFAEQVEAVGELIKEGKIRHWALSNETPYGVMSHVSAADAAGVPRPAVLQQSYSLIHRQAEGSLAELCSPAALGLGILPWSALAGGVLTGKYLDGKRPEGARMTMFEPRYARFMSERSQKAAKLYAKIAEDAGMTPAQMAYAFCRSQWFIPSTIIGATSVEQLQENLEAFRFPPLSSEILDRIDQVYLDHRDPSLED